MGLTDTDLAAIGGVGTFVLAAVAVFQTRENRRQTIAMRDQGLAVRGAARAQVQPIVFANAHGGAIHGPNDDYDLGEGEIGFAYGLSNEGTGVALNVRHGVEVAGVERAFGDGMEFRSIRPGETLPPPILQASASLPLKSLAVVFREDELPKRWTAKERSYWVRFENVFGDHFETRNPSDPRESAEFAKR